MTTARVARPVGEGTGFEIVYRGGARVRAVFGSAELARALRGPFDSYGVEIIDAAPASGAPTVTVCQVPNGHGLPVGPAWESLRVPHGGGDVAAGRGVTVVHGGPPLSIVTVAAPAISVAQYGAAPHLPFVHYLVKYPLRQQVERQGGVLAHSSAVEVAPGSCCLFLGRSGAGKTTAFVELVTRGFRVLGNDATLLTPSEGQVEAAAWPHVVRIGEATIAHNRVLAALPADWAPRNRRDGKTEVFFDTLDDVFGRRIAAPPARVAAIVDLALDTSSTGLVVRRLDPVQTAAFVGERLVGDRPPTGWLPGWTWQLDLAAVRGVADLLVDRVPMYRVHAGAATGVWADRLAEWVASLAPPHAPPVPASAPEARDGWFRRSADLN
jgi:hypothetical protein